MDKPRLVIAAPHGRSGKTTVTLGLISALVGRGLAVQPFKKGPDYIDPSWHTRAAGRVCRNLDRYFCTPEQVAAAFRRGTEGADLALIEGNHGLFDGLDLQGSGSTAEVARVLQAPVVLVVDATRMTRSVAALVRGFVDFDPQIRVAGVILNRVCGKRHRDMLTGSIAHYCGVPVLGVIPKSSHLTIPDRHLGLVPAQEEERQEQVLTAARRIVEEHVDLDALLRLAHMAEPIPYSPELTIAEAPARRARIGYLRDEAFSFYYPENLEALEASGAELVPISALSDRNLPPVDGLYLGGGFPEVFAEALEANDSLRTGVRQAVEAGMPVYAECGGLMYLCRTITHEGRQYEMAGALPADVVMEAKPQGHGYTLLEVAGENPFLPMGTLIKGHEFHHSRLINLDRAQVRFAYRVRKGIGIDTQNDGLVYRNVLAGYNHLHALAVPEWAEGLVSRAAQFRMAPGRV